MKFLCVECDRQMQFEERQLPGDGTLAAAFRCPTCGRVVALLTNPMETQLVASLGVKIGGRVVPPILTPRDATSWVSMGLVSSATTRPQVGQRNAAANVPSPGSCRSSNCICRSH